MKVFIPFNGISNGGDIASILPKYGIPADWAYAKTLQEILDKIYSALEQLSAEDDVEYKEKRQQFTYPDSVKKITEYIVTHGIPNVSLFTIEKLWYAYSEKYDAQFLVPDEYYLTEFIDLISKLEVEDSLHMDYYGNIK
jgi:hypothetical protein